MLAQGGAAPTGLSPLHVLTLCGPERVLVVSTEPPDDLSCLTTPGVGRPNLLYTAFLGAVYPIFIGSSSTPSSPTPSTHQT